MRYFYNRNFWKEMWDYLGAAADTPTFFEDPIVTPIIGTPVLTPDLVAADLEVPTYTGYATQTMSEPWGTPIYYGSGGIYLPAGEFFTFTVSGSGDPNVITGFALYKVATQSLVVCLFDETIIVENAGDGLVIFPTLPILGPVVTI